MPIERKQELREILAALALSHASLIVQLERATQLLRDEIEAEDEVLLVRPLPTLSPQPGLLLDRKTFYVYWHGSSCPLGNTLLFRFLERIARSPDHYVAYEDLLDDVWGGKRDHSSIRGIAKRLRDKLCSWGMAELAASIDGGETEGLSPVDVARMELEMDALSKDFKRIEELHGKNVLHLVIVVGYLKTLLDNAKIVRFLAAAYPEILTEFQKVVDSRQLEEPVEAT